MKIVAASADMADALQQLAKRSKAHWGYSDTYLQTWDFWKNLTPEFIANNPVFCALEEDQLQGFYALDLQQSPAELKHLWISPESIGGGTGSALMNHIMGFMAEQGIDEFQVCVEPNAEGFYQKMGGVQVGEQFRPALQQTYPIMHIPVTTGSKSVPQ